MKRLNNKGYLIVEIIVASTLAIGIGYFLVRLTIKFSKQEEDIYYSLFNTNQKGIITSTIMDDLTTYNVKEITVNDKIINITYYDFDPSSVEISNNNIKYRDNIWNLDNNLIIGNIAEPACYNNHCFVVIPIKDRYSNNNYDIRLMYRVEQKTQV